MIRTDFRITEHKFNNLIFEIVWSPCYVILISGFCLWLFKLLFDGVFANEFGYIGFTIVSGFIVFGWFCNIILSTISFRWAKNQLKENIRGSILWK